jgi:hypothetical protein
MERSLRNGLFLGALLGFVAADAVAATQTTPVVQVVMHDSSSAGEPTLAEARAFSASIFHAAGINIAAPGGIPACARSGARHFCVQVLLRPHHPEFQPGKVRTMGVALAADANRAVVTVYLDAVVDVARRYGQPVGKILGIALAHEIGHVLLPPPSHSPRGIMRPSWEGDALRHAVGGDIAFTDGQAALMRDRLNARPAIP